jgi:hypothetical protein
MGNFSCKMGLAEAGKKVYHESSHWLLWKVLTLTCFPCFCDFFSWFHANVHKKAQSPVCCVRKLGIFQGKCDGPEVDECCLWIQQLNFIRNTLGCMRALFWRFSSPSTQISIKILKVRYVVLGKDQFFIENVIGRRWIECRLWIQQFNFMRNTYIDSFSLFWQFFPSIRDKYPQK